MQEFFWIVVLENVNGHGKLALELLVQLLPKKSSSVITTVLINSAGYSGIVVKKCN